MISCLYSPPVLLLSGLFKNIETCAHLIYICLSLFLNKGCAHLPIIKAAKTKHFCSPRAFTESSLLGHSVVYVA